MDRTFGTDESGSATREGTAAARALMANFLRATGVTGDAPPRRYLWTDAFAVCTLLEFHRLGLEPESLRTVPGPDTPDARAGTPADSFLELALHLVNQVHHVLGRHRPDDPRTGWLSGLDEQAGEGHPTAGGLRIGKALPERLAGAPVDRRLEWERDGQYFHYLTRWMHALLRLHRATGRPEHLRWARELATAAYRGFLRADGPEGPHLAWKMSVDLSRPLVPTPGHHDALDGWITFLTLEAASEEGDDGLTAPMAGLREMSGVASGRGWATEDPLGLGGLLVNAWQVAQLDLAGETDLVHLLELLLASADAGLRAFLRSGLLQTEAGFRLPFRELGLSIGLHGVERLAESAVMDGHGIPAEQHVIRHLVNELQGALPLARRVEETWLDPAARELESWTGHRDINAVMLATSLVPDGYLGV